VSEGAVAVQNGAWACAGKTDIGVPNGDHNDDAIAVCAREAAGCLLAVADGTGDSKFGSRASTVALQGLIDAWCTGLSLEWAAKLAAAKLRADNCAHGLDGACTLAACVLHDDQAELVAIGDAFFVCVGADGQAQRSVFDKEQRSVLGGEPLGWTITSSGRLVENLNHTSPVDVLKVDHAQRVLLGSDGACTPGLNESLNELTEMLGRPGSPLGVVEGLVAGAQDRSRTTGAYDNISAVVALRCG
jgi:serine/threonine protein phosphatase PrpC